MSAEFFKIAVDRSDGKTWYVIVARHEQQQVPPGRTYYRHISFDTNTELAGIWPERAARATLEKIRVTCSTAHLMPSTFAEWIEAPNAHPINA